MANEIAMALSGCRSAIGQFVAPSMLSRSQSCAEEKERRDLFDQVSVHTYLDSSEN